jgi:hypothetical protein
MPMAEPIGVRSISWAKMAGKWSMPFRWKAPAPFNIWRLFSNDPSAPPANPRRRNRSLRPALPATAPPSPSRRLLIWIPPPKQAPRASRTDETHAFDHKVAGLSLTWPGHLPVRFAWREPDRLFLIPAGGTGLSLLVWPLREWHLWHSREKTQKALALFAWGCDEHNVPPHDARRLHTHCWVKGGNLPIPSSWIDLPHACQTGMIEVLQVGQSAAMGLNAV